jgi:hypothetical protein
MEVSPGSDFGTVCKAFKRAVVRTAPAQLSSARAVPHRSSSLTLCKEVPWADRTEVTVLLSSTVACARWKDIWESTA